MKNSIFLSLLFLFAGCNGSGGAFQSLEETSEGNAPEAPVEIVSFTPTIDPVVVTGSSETTFAVSVNGSAGTVNYQFETVGGTILQNSSSPFYTLLGSNLAPGNHILRLTATNSRSNAVKNFNVRRNNPPTISATNPPAAGNLVNCDTGTLTFSASTSDLDGDGFTQSWILDGTVVTGATPGVTITNTVSSARLDYTPTCAMSGFHTLILRLNDGFETTDYNWNISVANPAVETILAYDPTSNNIVYLSTDVSKTFSASGSGVGSLTFTWKLDGVTILTQSSVTFSSLNLLATSMTIGTHVLRLELTDSTATNDPPGGVFREWTIYKNQKPRILSPSPSGPVSINLNSPRVITANIEDALDTFTVSINKGALACVPDGSNSSAACGLSSISRPSSTGTFSMSFLSGTGFLGENNFLISVTDSHGETETQSFNLTANYFSDTCNQLNAGEICTLVGLPGLGSGTNVNTNSNRIRVAPSRIIKDERGNFFFSDHTSHTVWYYNTTAVPVSLLGVTVPAFTLYVVAGTGVAGAGINGLDARKMALNLQTWGGGLAWNPNRQELFIADYSNNRVVRVDSTGKGRTVCGLSNLTAQGSAARNTLCQGAADLAYDATNDRLYVAQLSNHIIKVIDTSDPDFTVWPAYTLAGAYNSGANSNGTTNLTSFYGTVAGGSRLNQPLGLYLDEEDQILYFTTYQACRVGAIGLPTSTTRTVLGQSITANNLRYIAGNACGSHTLNNSVAVTGNIFNRPTDLHVHRTGATIHGLYVTSHAGYRIMYLNNQATTTIGGQTITGGMANNVFGNGTANAPVNPPTGRNSNVNLPFGVLLDGNTLYVGARDGNIIRTLDIANGTVSNFIGGTGRAGYSGNAAMDSALITFNNPFSLFYKTEGGSSNDPIPGNTLFISDSSNFIIRSLNLSTGRVEDFIGNGTAGTENLSNTVTTNTRMRGPRSMSVYDGFFFYNDINANCFTRVYNPLSSDQTIFSSLINLNKTNTVAGNFNNCGHYPDLTPRSTTDLDARLNNPWGLGIDTDGTAYISSTSSHCILRVTQSGDMQPFIGTCGATAAPSVVANGSIESAPIFGTSTLLRAPGEIVMDTTSGNEGNFFFIDFSDTATANIKYVNLSNINDVSFFGGTVLVMANQIETVMALVGSPGFIRGLALFEDWICFSSGLGASGQNTITCRNRLSGASQIFGVPGIGGIQLEQEHEGVSVTSGASTVSFAQPTGLAFDQDGNLYVSEQGSHVIRKIKRWFP
jgi:hypothetical protein